MEFRPENTFNGRNNAQPSVAKLRTLLTTAAAEAIHDAGSCNATAALVELCETQPELLALELDGLSVTEAEVWRRVRELCDG